MIHNPHNLTDSQIEVSEGWRLLDANEIKMRLETSEIQMWRKGKATWDSFWLDNMFCGNNPKMTYRTKLSKEELERHTTNPYND